MNIYGVIGWPISHSLSPIMQEKAFQMLGIKAHYGVFPVHPNNLRHAILGIKALGIKGANVTLPHKETIIDLLDEVEEQALEIGAVNTLICKQGKLIGINTDAPGLIASIKESQIELKNKNIVIIGAGGAAKAACVGLYYEEIQSITIAARRVEAAESMVSTMQKSLTHKKNSSK